LEWIRRRKIAQQTSFDAKKIRFPGQGARAAQNVGEICIYIR